MNLIDISYMIYYHIMICTKLKLPGAPPSRVMHVPEFIDLSIALNSTCCARRKVNYALHRMGIFACIASTHEQTSLSSRWQAYTGG